MKLFWLFSSVATTFCSVLCEHVTGAQMSREFKMSFSSDSEPLFYWSSSGIYGPDEGWALAYPECREKNQSPVNILDQDTKVSTEYQELTLEGFDNESSNKTSMKNTGKTGENYTNIPACFCTSMESQDNTWDFIHSHIYTWFWSIVCWGGITWWLFTFPPDRPTSPRFSTGKRQKGGICKKM